MKIILVLVIIPACITNLYAFQDMNSDTSSIDCASEIESLKTTINELQNQRFTSYQEILEKTNQQLSLWYNPYGILIGTLAILFTLLTIIAAVILYSQGKGFKDQISSLLNRYTTLYKKVGHEWDSHLLKIETMEKDLQVKLETAKGKEKQTIETEIEKLKKERASVASDIASTVAPMQSFGSGFIRGFTPEYHKCTQCDKDFIDYNRTPGLHIFGKTRSLICPNCGEVNEVPD